MLVPRLKAPGKIGDIAREVRREVRKLASHVNHVQTPAFYDEVLGDFCPAACAMEAKADATVPVKVQPPPPDPAMEAWNATRGGKALTCSLPTSPNTQTPFTRSWPRPGSTSSRESSSSRLLRRPNERARS